MTIHPKVASKAASIDSALSALTVVGDADVQLAGLDIEQEAKLAAVPTPQTAAAALTPGADESQILTGKKLALVFAAMLLSVLLMALDQTILATALPRIASDFDAFTLQGWVSSAFVLTQTPFLLICSQVLRIWPAKWVLFWAVTIFEVGSAVCGASQDVYQLIFGRALSGVGAAGVFVGSLQILAQISRLEDRPKLMGMFGGVFGLSSVIGPLTGGAFTDHVSWRWCFYINLPVGGVTLLALFFLLKSAPPLGSDPNERTLRSRLRQTARMDWVGGTLIFAAVTSLCLGLQWGGNTKPWNSAAVIVTLVLAPVLFVVVVFWFRFRGERAMVPPEIFGGGLKRAGSVVAIILFAFMVRFSMFIFTYYLPVLYQISRGYSATKSGIAVLPFMLSSIAAVVGGGQLVARTHRYWPFLVVGPPLAAIGAGLFYTVHADTSSAKVIGYQLILGVGIGITIQNPVLAMQAEFRNRPKLIGQATGMATFGQNLGATIGLAVAEAAFSSELTKNLLKYAPDVDPTLITESPTDIHSVVPTAELVNVIKAYCLSLDVVFVLGVPFSIAAFALAFAIKNVRLDAPKAGEKEEVEDKKERIDLEKGVDA